MAAAAERFSWDLKWITDDGSCIKDYYNVNETGLFWKTPSRTFAVGFKPAKDRLILLISTNACSTSMLKPVLLYHSENSRTLKTMLKLDLQCTGSLKWQYGSLQHCLKNGLTAVVYKRWRKVWGGEHSLQNLLLVDNAPDHPWTSDIWTLMFESYSCHPTPYQCWNHHCATAAFTLYYPRAFSKCITIRNIKEGPGQKS